MAEQPKKKSSLLKTLVLLALLLVLLPFAGCLGMCAYGSSIPESHTSTGSETIKADIDDVFALQANVQKYPEWHDLVKEIRDYKEEPNGAASWTEEWKDGNVFAMKRTAYIKEKLIRVEIEDTNEVFSGSWTFDFADLEEGTKVTITENGNIPNNFIRGMYHLTSEPDQTLKEHLRRLKTVAEEREAK
jgi:uncharacterized membrane protein